MRILTVVVVVGAGLVGCGKGPLNTLPPVPSPDGATLHYDIEVPAGLEVKTVDFEAATFSSVSGSTVGGIGSTSSSVGGRAFLKVQAVHRSTGDQYLLLYEDIGTRSSPTHIVRLQTNSAIDLPGRR